MNISSAGANGIKSESEELATGPWQAPFSQSNATDEVADGASDGDGYYSSDDDGFDLEQEITLDSIVKRKTINYSIRASYTTWVAWEAFRELVQNWRDAIIRSFKLRENEFHVLREEKSGPRNTTEIVYRVLQPNSEPKTWLGYIRFKGRADGLGCVDMVNRKATLQPFHLDMGGTSKEAATDQAGAFGEGLKLALLVLMRNPQNHSVLCRSGGFTWKFDFTNQGKLVTRLSRMSPQAILNARSRAEREVQAGKTLLPFAAAPDEDVQFLIGQNCMGRDSWGRRVRRSLVSADAFRSWLKAALFLQETKDGGVILTKSGDLIREERLRGNLYLKGLLLGESTADYPASVTGKELCFGYNFGSGKTNRDREALASAAEESQAILSIWNRSLSLRPPIVEELSNMLNSSETEYADVSMAIRCIKIETVCRLKDYLFGESFADRWYYTAREKGENPRLENIIRGLGCEAVQLKDSFWAILRKHNFIRTAEEEQQRRFLRAEPVSVPGTHFAMSVHRLLRACIHACPQTDKIAVQFVDAGSLLLQSYHDEAGNVFKIHSRWLTSDGAAEELGLEGDLMIEDDIIFHAVKSLFDDILELVPDDAFDRDGADGGRASIWYRRREVNQAEQRLLGYLRVHQEIDFYRSAFSYRPEIGVSWLDSFAPNLRTNNTQVEVQLHLVRSCSHLRDALISSDVSWDKLPCKPRDDNDLLRDPTVLEKSHSKCVIVRRSFASARFQLESGFKGGDEYFFIFSVASEPRSIAIISSDTWVIPRRAPTPEPVKKKPEGSDESASKLQSDKKQQGETSNPQTSPVRPATPLPARENTPASPTPPPAEPRNKAGGSTNGNDGLKHGTRYKLGAPRPDLETLTTTRKSKLFDAIHTKSNEVKGVIAVFTDDSVEAHASDSRKRARIVYEINP